MANRAVVWQDLREYDRAVADLERALELDSAETRVRIRLAFVLLTAPSAMTRNPQKALEIALPILREEQQDERNNFLLMQLGAAMAAEEGNFKQAAKFQHLAIGIAETDDESQTARERLELYEARKPCRLPKKEER